MKKGDLFPIADAYRYPGYMVQYTGEKRAPRINEWFLSGAVIEGYLASHNMSVAYHIAKRVKVKVTAITKVEVIE